jgi:LysM repeat protein
VPATDTAQPAPTTPPPAPPPAARPAAESAAREHTIARGETLDAISKRYGLTVQQLQDANPGLNARRLIPGRTVRLPGGASRPAGSPDAEARAAAPAESARPARHTIRAGDTLDGIARRYGTTVRALEDANPGLNPRRLIPGRTINLPN